MELSQVQDSESQTMSSTIPSFVRIADNESFEREYYIAHTNRKRFNVKAIFLIVAGFCCLVVPGIVLLAYFGFRRLKVSHGYACVTSKRVVYYEFNEHPEENYRLVRSVHVDDLTSISFRISRTMVSKSFYMVLWTTRRGMVVGAAGLLGRLNLFGDEQTLEPGPDALDFVRDMSGAIAARKFQLSGPGGSTMA